MMSRSRLLAYMFVSIAAGVAFFLVFINRFENAVKKSAVEQAQTAVKKDRLKTTAHLYFAHKENSFLIAEERELSHTAEPVNFGKMIIAALADGPQQDLMRTLPEGVTLRAFFIDHDKTAYVDLAGAVNEKHPGGTRTEILTIYSIVNSLVLNVQEIDAVKILVAGRESMTLCGHIDLRFPFKADMLLVR